MRVGIFVCFMSPLRLRVSVEQMNQYPVFVDLFQMEDRSQLLFNSSRMALIQILVLLHTMHNLGKATFFLCTLIFSTA